VTGWTIHVLRLRFPVCSTGDHQKPPVAIKNSKRQREHLDRNACYCQPIEMKGVRNTQCFTPEIDSESELVDCSESAANGPGFPEPLLCKEGN